MQHQSKVVIIGGGAGGLELATALGHKLGKSNRASITLVDKNLTHIWKPLLHEIAAGTLDSSEDELNYITHAYYHHFRFQLGEFTALDRKKQVIELTLSHIGKKIESGKLHLPYDLLIIAVGSVSNNYNIPGVNEYCYYLDDHKQAERFHRVFINELMRIQHKTNRDQKKRLQVVIIGGGATGVELAAELHYSYQKAIYYGLKKIESPEQSLITIIEGTNRILSTLPKRISQATVKALKKLDVNIMTGERVKQVTETKVITASGLHIPATITIWAAGIKAPDFLRSLDNLETNTINQLMVKETLQTTVDDNIFAIGDCVACLQKDGKAMVPARAQAAHQQATILVKSIVNILNGKPSLQYYYRDYGSLISISRYEAVGQLMGRITRVMIEGKIAHLVYLSLYKMHQIKLHGWWSVMLLSLAKLLSRRVKPKIKLH